MTSPIKFPASLLVAALLAMPSASMAQDAQLTFNGDRYVAGQQNTLTSATDGDAFVAGYDVDLAAPVTGDAHAAGFNVAVDDAIGGNLYAAGFNVDVSAPVAGDVTAFGNGVAIRSSGVVSGNARLAGATVTLAGEIKGSALVSTRSLSLAAPVGGDLSFYGEAIAFGPEAGVAGTLTIHAPSPIEVPASVASADRVKFEALAVPDYVAEAGKTTQNVVQGLWPAFIAFWVWYLVLFALGALLIAMALKRTQRLEGISSSRPWRVLLAGLGTAAALLGSIPLAAFTLIGLFLVPFLFIGVLVMGCLGYLVGIYLLGFRVGSAITPVDSSAKRIAVLAAGLVMALLVGLIPVLGWLVSLVIALFGLGAMTLPLFAFEAADASRPGSRPASFPVFPPIVTP